MIAENIKEFLLINRMVSLPGIGVLQFKPETAGIDRSKDFFTPPDDKIVFHYSEMKYDNHDFENFVAEKQKITITEAKRRIDEFIFGIDKKLKDNGIAKVSSLGYFIKEADRVIFNEAEIKQDLKRKNFGLGVFEFKKGKKISGLKLGAYSVVGIYAVVIIICLFIIFGIPKINPFNSDTNSDETVIEQTDLRNTADVDTKYYIIEGTYSNEENAKKMKGYLVKNGYKSEVIFYKRFYRVAFESFINVKEAENKLKQIKSNPNTKDSWILEYNSATKKGKKH